MAFLDRRRQLAFRKELNAKANDLNLIRRRSSYPDSRGLRLLSGLQGVPTIAHIDVGLPVQTLTAMPLMVSWSPPSASFQDGGCIFRREVTTLGKESWAAYESCCAFPGPGTGTGATALRSRSLPPRANHPLGRRIHKRQRR